MQSFDLKTADAGRVVEMNIKDSGSGIPQHLVPRMFQPFFTTKPGRQGLSLSRAKRYAELNKGDLELMATRPGSTVFRLRFRLGDD